MHKDTLVKLFIDEVSYIMKHNAEINEDATVVEKVSITESVEPPL